MFFGQFTIIILFSFLVTCIFLYCFRNVHLINFHFSSLCYFGRVLNLAKILVIPWLAYTSIFALVSGCVGQHSDICNFYFTLCSMCWVHCSVILPLCLFYSFIFIFFMLTLCRIKRLYYYRNSDQISAIRYNPESGEKLNLEHWHIMCPSIFKKRLQQWCCCRYIRTITKII